MLIWVHGSEGWEVQMHGTNICVASLEGFVWLQFMGGIKRAQRGNLT